MWRLPDSPSKPTPLRGSDLPRCQATGGQREAFQAVSLQDGCSLRAVPWQWSGRHTGRKNLRGCIEHGACVAGAGNSRGIFGPAAHRRALRTGSHACMAAQVCLKPGSKTRVRVHFAGAFKPAGQGNGPAAGYARWAACDTPGAQCACRCDGLPARPSAVAVGAVAVTVRSSRLQPGTDLSAAGGCRRWPAGRAAAARQRRGRRRGNLRAGCADGPAA